MDDNCKLRETQGAITHCDQDACIYWRIAGHLDVVEDTAGCAIQYFQLLDGGEDVATWLLSVKNRLEATASCDNS